MNREELVRFVVIQVAMVAIVGVLAGAFFARNVCVSALLGCFCVAVPNACLGLRLLISQLTKIPMGAVSYLLWEMLRLIAMGLMMFLSAKGYPELNFPAMLVGAAVVLFSQFLLLFFKH